MAIVPLGDLLSLIGLIKAHLETGIVAGDPVAGEIRRVLKLLAPVPPLSGTFSRNRHPATSHLEAALNVDNAATTDLLNAIRPVASHLPWRYSYAKRKDAPSLAQTIAFAELIGPEAPFRSETVCLGLTLIAPETLYPAHAHPAIELYYVVSGTAEWTAGDISGDQPPGAFILHPSNVVHAMRTASEPLLAVYTWSGDDVKTLSTYADSTQP